MVGLGDELLRKEDSFSEAKQEVTVSRGSHSSAWVCCDICLVETLRPGCRKEACALRGVGMQGVLRPAHGELPKSPLCLRVKSISLREDCHEMKSVG